MNYPSFSEKDETTKQQYIVDLKSFEQEMINLKLPIYLIYGTLLGALREKDFIAHDTDIDIAYLSSCKNKEDVRIERQELIKYFTEHNMMRSNLPTIGIKTKYGASEDMFDLWASWIEEDKYYLIPQINGLNKEILLPFKTLNFKGTNFLIPNKSEELLDIVYFDWKTPINKRYLRTSTQIKLIGEKNDK